MEPKMGIPTDLMERLQSHLRSEARLESYDPHDPTLPAVPSISQSVSSLDHSPPNHRCSNCSASLVNGSLSAVCVYCGVLQSKDPKPHNLKFRDTLGSAWLLQSLALDGSEIVEPSIVKQSLNRGQITPNEKIPLSDLLNMEIPWLAEPEISERSVLKDLSKSKSLTNLGGVDLDNLFTYVKDSVSDLGEEQAMTKKQTENMNFNAFAGQENRGISPINADPVIAATSSEAKSNTGFSGWEADFQSANSSSTPEPLKSPGQLVSPSVNLSTDMDSVSGSREHQGNIKTKDVSSNVAEQVGAVNAVKDHANADNFSPSPSSGWFPDQGNVEHTSSSNAQDPFKRSFSDMESKPTIGGEDSSDVWDDFTASSFPLDPSKSSFAATEFKSIAGDDESSNVGDEFTSTSKAQDPSRSSFAVTEIKATTEDDCSSDAWDGFTGSSSAHDPFKTSFSSTEIKATIGDDNSFDVWDSLTSSSKANDPFKSTNTITENKPTAVDDSSDLWDDFASFSNVHDSAKNAITTNNNKTSTGVGDSSEVWGALTKFSDTEDTITITASGGTTTNGVDDSFDVWGGFTGSSNAHDTFRDTVTATGNKETILTDDSSDVWDVFTSSSNAHDPVGSSITVSDKKTNIGVDDSSDVWDVFTSSSNGNDPFKSFATATGKEATTGFNDSSDFWDGFTSSSGVQNPSVTSNTNSVVEIATDGEQTLDTKFTSSTANFQEMDFGSFSQSDVSFGLVSDKNDSKEVSKMQSEVSTSKRMLSDEVEEGGVRTASKGGDGSIAAVKTNADMESLFSQMHDLSFMLKTELSFPSMKDNPSPSQDIRPNS